jgi:hypothetical protein
MIREEIKIKLRKCNELLDYDVYSPVNLEMQVDTLRDAIKEIVIILDGITNDVG